MLSGPRFSAGQSFRDGLITATALVHNLVVVSRNLSDVQASRVRLLNPWQGGQHPRSPAAPARPAQLVWSSLVWQHVMEAMGSPTPPPAADSRVVNMLEAKTHLSRLVQAIESGAETEVVIARNGRPVARLTSLRTPQPPRRLGVARGQFSVPDSIDAANPQIAELFEQG